MKSLLIEKLAAIEKLKSYTAEIILLSPKSDSETISQMIEDRRKYIDEINNINNEIEAFIKENSFQETKEIKNLKNDIKEGISSIIEMDKDIRKHINEELKSLKDKLNQPEAPSKIFNIKI